MPSTSLAPSERSGGLLLGSQQPRILHVPEFVSSAGEEAIELAMLAGLDLDEWQQLVLTAMLGERADGKWAAFEVGLVVPRQNGKGSILEARELVGLFLLNEQLIIHSAHEQATSSEHFRRLEGLILSDKRFHSRVKPRGAKHGKGSESIELRGGQRILFKTRTGPGGRGLTGNLVVLDEAMILPEATTGALVPTMAATSVYGNPQLVYAGSAVDQDVHEHGVVLARVRDRALRRVADLAYAEWSAGTGDAGEDDPAKVPDDVRADPCSWAQANPGMGIRISQEHIAKEHAGALGARTFCVERLGVGDWPDVTEDAGRRITKAAWAACLDADEVPPERIRPVCLAFDVSPDRGMAAIAIAGPRPDRKTWQAEVVEHGPGTDWVIDSLFELQRRHRPAAIVFDKIGPAASLLEELSQRKLRKLAPVGTGEVAQACGVFFDAVAQATLRHVGQEDLDLAVEGAGTRPLGDAWAWKRVGSTADITPLVAVTLALWAAMARKKKRAGVVNLAAALAAAEAAENQS